MACVSPTNMSVAATSGRENVASPCEKLGERHHARGTTSTRSPIMLFQMSGAVPIPTDESPLICSSSATVRPSGNGQDHTRLSPIKRADWSSPRRKKETMRSFVPASICGLYKPFRKTGTGFPKPSLVMAKLIAPLPPKPAVKYEKHKSFTDSPVESARRSAHSTARRFDKPGNAPAASNATVPAAAASCDKVRAARMYSTGSERSTYTGTSALTAARRTSGNWPNGPAVWTTASASFKRAASPCSSRQSTCSKLTNEDCASTCESRLTSASAR
mmetsp:Transcript_20821/g.34329  ORF Transcript_20821/g.34329 Transcript_20821/m.34329 type:complete len:274 (+) Transcript_20821:578-1399(+)